MSSIYMQLFRRFSTRVEAPSSWPVQRARIWVGLLIWCAPYIVLGTVRYGFGHDDIGQPLSWFLALIGLQLFASIAVVPNVWAGRSLVCAAILVYVVYFSGLVPGFAAVDSVLPQLCIMALMSISLWLPFASGQLSLAQGGFMAIGAYASAWLTMQAQWPFLPALLVSATGVALFGFIVSYPALRLKGVYLAVATLGLGEVIRIFFMNFEPTGGAFGLAGIPKHTQTWHLVLAVVMVCVILYFLIRGRIGRAIWAVRNDPIAAMALGINITHIRILTFTSGAFIAGLAGGFQAHYIQFVTPDNFDLTALIDWLTIVMLGGFETFFGALAATVVLGTLPELMRFLSEWRLLFNGAILVVFLILRPSGIITRELLGWKFSPTLNPGLNRTGKISAQEQAEDQKRSSTQKHGFAQNKASTSAQAPALSTTGRHSAELRALLQVKQVSKHFGGITALSDVSLDVWPGEIHGLIGPNGAGKTTLFNTIAGFYSVDSGTILLNGEAINNQPAQRLVTQGISRTFQNIRLFGSLTALENVMLGAHTLLSPCLLASQRRLTFWDKWSPLNQDKEHATAEHALELLSLLGLASLAQRPASTLSYGDQRRLEIARALAGNPKILLLDEPAAGMNAIEAMALGQLLRQLCQHLGKTILVVEHDMELVMGLCDRITVLNYGRRIASGTPGQVQDNPEVIAAYLGSPTQEIPEPSCDANMWKSCDSTQQASCDSTPQFSNDMLNKNGELLCVNNLVTRYGNIEAVKSVSIQVNDGEIVALIGANGAGKSTTLLTISGVLTPTSGTIHFKGQKISGSPSHQIVRQGIAQVVEGRAILSQLTVLENLMLGAYIREGREAIEQDQQRIFGRFPRLRERSGQIAGTLSGGEQQMLAIARALMSRPKMLLLDEPSMGLAPLIVEEIFNLLLELNNEGLTILLVEQNATQALKIADRAYVMASGVVVRSGPSQALLADDNLREAYLGAAR